MKNNLQTTIVSSFCVGAIGLASFGVKRYFSNKDSEYFQKLKKDLEEQAPSGQEESISKTDMGEGEKFDKLRSMKIQDLQELRLSGEIYAGDIAILTGATNMGKSLVAMQLAIDIASSRPSSLFPYLPVCGMPNDVYIYDAEQRLEQIKNRYFNDKNVVYPSNITRYPSCNDNATNIEAVFNTMEKTVNDAKRSITWIIDNLTILISHNTGAQVSDFLAKVKGLRAKMREKGLYLTVIVVTHTNDKYNKEDTRPIKEANIYGSSFLADFADSIIGIHNKRKEGSTEVAPYVQIIKTRAACLYEGFFTKRVSRPYAMLKYDDRIPDRLLFGGRKPMRDIDFSKEGVEFMFLYLYLECGMSPREIGRLYNRSHTHIIDLFKKYYGTDYTNYFLSMRGAHNPEKGREYFEHRMEYINLPPKDELGGEQKDQ